MDHIVRLSSHSKWEVRLACAEALGLSGSPRALSELKRLADDPVLFVQEEAEKSLKAAKRVTTKVYEKRDPTAERLFNLIKKMNPHNIREAYAAALQVGQIYYRCWRVSRRTNLEPRRIVWQGRFKS